VTDEETDASLQRIADELGEPIEIVRDLHEAMQACGAEGALEARADRAQRAREAALDAADDEGRPLAEESDRLDVAIETATRVRVDADILAAAREGRQVAMTTKELKRMIEAAFAAAGFEVEK
jgi:hypothetical protein